MTKHEIGLVYRRNSKLFIAVSETKLVCGDKGTITEVRPNVKYDLVRNMSVEELCEEWAVSLEQFDSLMSVYLSPSDVEIKSRPRGTKRAKGDDDEFWKRHRTGRITRPTL